MKKVLLFLILMIVIILGAVIFSKKVQNFHIAPQPAASPQPTITQLPSNTTSVSVTANPPASCADCPAGFYFCRDKITNQTSCINSAIGANQSGNLSCQFCPYPSPHVTVPVMPHGYGAPQSQ